LAVTTTWSNDRTLHVLINRGDGLFHPVVSYDTKPPLITSYFPAIALAAGDLNGDGRPELVVGHEGGSPFVMMLRNRGDGTFHPKEALPAPALPYSLAIADLDGDGHNDWLVAGSYLGAVVRALLNDGAGTLMATQSVQDLTDK